jgi:hypothetical protein
VPAGATPPTASVAEPSTAQFEWHTPRLTSTPTPGHLTLILILILTFVLVLDKFHALPYRARDRLSSAPSDRVTQRAEGAATSPVRRPEHAATPINAIVDDKKVVVAGKLVFVYAV